MNLSRNWKIRGNYLRTTDFEGGSENGKKEKTK
jgi:hypothetical protein